MNLMLTNMNELEMLSREVGEYLEYTERQRSKIPGYLWETENEMFRFIYLKPNGVSYIILYDKAKKSKKLYQEVNL